jgi:hypothetical protein
VLLHIAHVCLAHTHAHAHAHTHIKVVPILKLACKKKETGQVVSLHLLANNNPSVVCFCRPRTYVRTVCLQLARIRRLVVDGREDASWKQRAGCMEGRQAGS